MGLLKNAILPKQGRWRQNNSGGTGPKIVAGSRGGNRTHRRQIGGQVSREGLGMTPWPLTKPVPAKPRPVGVLLTRANREGLEA